MDASPAERRIRASFPFIRLMQSFMPHRLSGWLNKQGVRRVRLPAGVSHSTLTANRVPCVWVVPQGSAADQVLLYLHGGGFVYGLSPLHLPMVAYLAKKMSVRALMVDYRLAPEHPYPAALDDCVTAYRWLLEQGMLPQDIALAGDSAGGNLVITSLMKLRDHSVPLPAAAACLSPVTDLAANDDRIRTVKDPLLPPRAIRYYNQSYVGTSDPHDPLISPVYGDLKGLPPLLVHAGGDELLREDAVQFTELAKSAGVEVRLEVYPRMWHVWQLYLSLPQAQQSLDDIAGFLKINLPAAVQQSVQP